jgi:hypothetical protein
MGSPVTISPDAVFDDDSIVSTLGIPAATLLQARKQGHLRHTRKGKRVLYLGKWILAWLGADEAKAVNCDA